MGELSRRSRFVPRAPFPSLALNDAVQAVDHGLKVLNSRQMFGCALSETPVTPQLDLFEAGPTLPGGFVYQPELITPRAEADEGERPAGALDLCGTKRATPAVYGAFARFTECLAKP